MATRDATHAGTWDRVTIQEAARRLQVKDDAIRKRIQRGTLESEKDPDGRVYVYLDATQDATHAGTRDTAHDAAHANGEDRGELVELMRDEIAHLRGQLEEEREARRRADTIIVQLSQATAEQARTIRAIEPPQAAADDLGGVEVRDAGADVQTGSQPPQDNHHGDHHGDRQAEPRSWWRKLFE